ncbi:MAG: hypothetical protein AABY07_01385 [Nanoarchaeota archaeon]
MGYVVVQNSWEYDDDGYNLEEGGTPLSYFKTKEAAEEEREKLEIGKVEDLSRDSSWYGFAGYVHENINQEKLFNFVVKNFNPNWKKDLDIYETPFVPTDLNVVQLEMLTHYLNREGMVFYCVVEVEDK